MAMKTEKDSTEYTKLLNVYRQTSVFTVHETAILGIVLTLTIVGTLCF